MNGGFKPIPRKEDLVKEPKSGKITDPESVNIPGIDKGTVEMVQVAVSQFFETIGDIDINIESVSDSLEVIALYFKRKGIEEGLFTEDEFASNNEG